MMLSMTESIPSSAADRSSLSQVIRDEARRIGFELVGISPAVTPTGVSHLQDWLQAGYAGEMQYLPNRKDAYEHPQHVLEGVRSVVMLALNYHTQAAVASCGSDAQVAKYAWGEQDYHDVLRGKLKQLSQVLHDQMPGCRTRGVVDTAPLLERDFARLSGLGWFGKNTMLINKQAGSWLFLAALLVDAELDYDSPHETSHCGTCTRCLDACPTDAFPEPYVLDARRCISYLTIELRDKPIPLDLREGVGDWLFGCDICQDVCPWNRKAPVSNEPAFQPRDNLRPTDAVELLALTEDEFRARFRKTPLSRPRWAGLLRNAAIVLGNSADPTVLPALITALDHPEPLVRGAAAWAVGRLEGSESCAALQTRLGVEDNADVQAELQAAIEMTADNLKDTT
jgi:epoxyqueuosine reductase